MTSDRALVDTVAEREPREEPEPPVDHKPVIPAGGARRPPQPRRPFGAEGPAYRPPIRTGPPPGRQPQSASKTTTDTHYRVYAISSNVLAELHLPSGEAEQLIHEPFRIKYESEYLKKEGAPPDEPKDNELWYISTWHKDAYPTADLVAPDLLVVKALNLSARKGWEVCGQETAFGLVDRDRISKIPPAATWVTRTYTLKRPREEVIHE